VRGTLPGLAYQLGNLIASINAPLQASIAERHGGDYALSLAIVAGVTAIVIALLAAFSSERKDVAFGAETPG
jgi:SHS family lactate transporter-like MFS transporter